MQRITVVFLILFAAGSAYPQHQHGPQPSSQVQAGAHPSSSMTRNSAEEGYRSDPVTVTGYLRDTECLLKNPKAGEANTDETRACLRACYRGGSPLGVLTRDGQLYTLLGQDTPDNSLRSKLEPLAGHYVRVTGWKVVRGGSQALIIKKVVLEK